MKIAALDLGTNSFLCLIAEVQDGRIKKIYSDQVEIVRLGQGVNENKKFHPDALVRARASLSNFKKTIDEQKPEAVLAMATSAARDVSNADELFKIGRDLNIPIEIIPGEKEAEITYRGALSSLDSLKIKNDPASLWAVIDVGGGSTEIIVGTRDKVLGGGSLNLGGVRLTEKFFSNNGTDAVVSSEQINLCQRWIDQEIKKLLTELSGFSIANVLAVAGTPTELARAQQGMEIDQFVPEKIDGFVISQNDLQNWVQKFAQTTAQQRTHKYKINPGRADIILAGTMILSQTLAALGMQALTVSTRGVRYGVALEMENRNKTS